MDHVLTFPRAEQSAGDAGTDTLDRGNRTFICAVLFLDIEDYSKKPVSQQLRMKERFNACLSEALANIAANDRIILDTGDGAAINFLGDLEDALFVAISLAQLFKRPPADELPLEVRIGINLGPVQLMRDINGQLNIIGDGINVAERVMSFASSGQVLVSRSCSATRDRAPTNMCANMKSTLWNRSVPMRSTWLRAGITHGLWAPRA
jgi:class 3 adenylate cyclase